MHPEAGHGTPVASDACLVIECSEALQQGARARQHRRRRLIQPGKLPHLPRAPARELESERCEIGIQNLRWGGRAEPGLCAFAPGAVADTGRGAPGSAPALLGGSARDTLRLQATHAGDWVEARAPHQTRINHYAHAGNGETRLGDVGREHHFAQAAFEGRESGVLRFGRQVAEQRHHRNGAKWCGLQQRLHAADFAAARQKHQHISLLLAQCSQDQLRDESLRRLCGPPGAPPGQQRQPLAGVARLDIEGSRGGAEPRGIAKQACHRRAIERRRHDQDA